jgi:hypothetical protein
LAVGRETKETQELQSRRLAAFLFYWRLSTENRRLPAEPDFSWQGKQVVSGQSSVGSETLEAEESQSCRLAAFLFY